MYGVALPGLSMFLLANFAMMSSHCFIWKSILECLELPPPLPPPTSPLLLSCHFLIVFHLKLANVYTETTVVSMERQLRRCRGKNLLGS